MKEIYIQYYTIQGIEFILGVYEDKLCVLDFVKRKKRKQIDTRVQKYLGARYVFKEHVLLQETHKQLREYFSKKRKTFDIPLLIVGTEFQKSVWKALLEVSYASTLSYIALARILGKPKAVRALANANGVNALAIVIPCHRVLRSDGDLGGYSGGRYLKKKLLELEYKDKDI